MAAMPLTVVKSYVTMAMLENPGCQHGSTAQQGRCQANCTGTNIAENIAEGGEEHGEEAGGRSKRGDIYGCVYGRSARL